MPVNAVEIKLPDIFRIVGKGIAAVSMPESFSKCIIGCNCAGIHNPPFTHTVNI